MDRLTDYDYNLPETLIARKPLEKRDESRLMVVNRAAGTIAHHNMQDFPNLLNAGDLVVLNDTRVIPARMLGQRQSTGGKWEGLYVGSDDMGNWRIIGSTRGKLIEGEIVSIHPAHEPNSHDRLNLKLHHKDDDGTWTAQPIEYVSSTLELLQRFGTVPLPPYIKRDLASKEDWQRYQTTYSKKPGAVAAPTAGLHFTPELLQQCQSNDIEHRFATLHVGVGTFKPINVEQLNEHVMHSEWCEITEDVCKDIKNCRDNGGKLVAIGTTSVRTLESAAGTGTLHSWQGQTDLFIRPPYTFRVVDHLLTNFHLPKSSLLVLVSAFAGVDLIREAYATAVKEEYRFFSYGDAMLIL